MTDPNLLSVKLERTMRLYQATGYRAALRPAQWQALRFFATAPEAERTVSGLARARASTMGTTSITVTALVDRGLLERAAGHRNVGLKVTPAGQRLLDDGDPARALETTIAELPADDRATLDRTLSDIIRALEPAVSGLR